MHPAPSYRLLDWLLMLLVLAAAGGARAYYVMEYAKNGEADQTQIAHVQVESVIVGVPPKAEGDAAPAGKTDTDLLVENLRKEGNINGFRSHAPLSRDNDEPTAHVAPGYPVYRWLVEMGVAELKSETIKPSQTMMWVQVVLGALTAVCYFAAGRRAFHSAAVGTVAGLLCSANPFWIINVAELNDGVLITFLLAVVIALGVKAGQRGGPLTSFLLGLFLAALPMVRAAFLPFAFVTLMWFFLRSRNLRHGWLYALLVFFGFVNGMAPWGVRNWQQFQEPIPVVDSFYWHLWVGNNPEATGNPLAPGSQWTLEKENTELVRRLGKETVDQIKEEKSQPAAYNRLAPKILDEVRDNPGGTVERRLNSAKGFFFGVAPPANVIMNEAGEIVGGRKPSSRMAIIPSSEKNNQWDCCRDHIQPVFLGVVVGMLFLALIGWRWSAVWGRASMPLQLAVFWIPVPYVLTYSEWLHGPRLPLDGPLMVLAAVAIIGCIPFVGGRLLRGEANVVPAVPPPPGVTM